MAMGAMKALASEPVEGVVLMVVAHSSLVRKTPRNCAVAYCVSGFCGLMAQKPPSPWPTFRQFIRSPVERGDALSCVPPRILSGLVGCGAIR